MEDQNDDQLVEIDLQPANVKAKKGWKLKNKVKKNSKYAPIDYKKSTIQISTEEDDKNDNSLDIDKVKVKRANTQIIESEKRKNDQKLNKSTSEFENVPLRRRSFSETTQMCDLRSSVNKDKNHTYIFSLKVLCTAVVCKNVNLYKGTKIQPSIEELQKLLKVMVHFNWIEDQNLPFFLSEGQNELDLTLNHQNQKVTDLSMSFISVCCPQLSTLYLDHWNNITDKGWKTFCMSAETSLVSTLRKLSLNFVPLTKKIIDNISSSFKELRYLHLDSCEIMKDPNVLETLGNNLGHNIRGLSLKDLNLPSASIAVISSLFPKLEDLDVTVSSWDPYYFPDYATSEAIGTLSNCKNLKKLILSGMMFDDDCISRICKNCSYLEVLNLSWVDINSAYAWSIKLTDKALFDISCCSQLKELGLGYCSRIKKEQTLLNLLCALPNLEKLNLTSVPAVCDNVIINMAETCPKMKRLKLQNCIVNPCSLFAIGKHCNRLEYLDVRGKTIQTDSAWNAIAEGCQQLQTVLCQNMSPEARVNLHFQCPLLKVKMRSSQ